jgi:hypothetical protein
VYNIFEELMKEGYYKACCDYGRFLVNEKKLEEAKKILKIGYDNCQQFCFSDYFYLLISITDFKNYYQIIILFHIY